MKSEIFRLEVIGKTPEWVNTLSSENDENINGNSGEASKTFGLKYLISGVSEAFYPNNQKNIIAQLEFNISRTGGSSILLIVVFSLLILVIIIVIIMKRNK